MFLRTLNIIIYKVLVDALLAALSTRPAAALAALPKVHLFVNDFTPSSSSVLLDFTEAAFDGYAAVSLTSLLGPILVDSNDRAMHAEADFIGATVVAPGEIVYGYYITDDAGAVLWASERFATPVTIVHTGDFISLDVCFPEPFTRTIS